MAEHRAPATFYIGDVFERMAELTGPFDLVITSPPFSNLRSYLPDGHPDKHLEIGSEPTAAEYMDVMLRLTAEWGRLLSPWGSLAVEIGDTYSDGGGSDDPLAKSLMGIPHLYMLSLAYGRNMLTGEASPAGRWRIRNYKPWIRSNPPVGALGDKERPATSYITVACRATDRYFDLDAVRTAPTKKPQRRFTPQKGTVAGQPHQPMSDMYLNDEPDVVCNPAGAPPLDWWHPVDALIDNIIDEKAGAAGPVSFSMAGRKHTGADNPSTGWQQDGSDRYEGQRPGARGVHIRRALEQAGHLHTLDALDVSPKGYAGAHYAVWPPLLVKLLLQEMCPRRVCTTCGRPSRRIVSEAKYIDRRGVDMTGNVGPRRGYEDNKPVPKQPGSSWGPTRTVDTLGWSDCGHGTWRPARILDPFAGSGTTLAVATGHGIDADGIDIDTRNALLAQDRVGAMLLDIVWPNPDYNLQTLPRGDSTPGAYSGWVTDQQAEVVLAAMVDVLHSGTAVPAPVVATYVRPRARQTPSVAGQVDLFNPDGQGTIYDEVDLVPLADDA